MNKYFKFEPVATLVAAQVLVQSLIVLLVSMYGISQEMLLMIEGVNTGLFALFATFVRHAVTPNATLEALRDLPQEQLDALAAMRS
jgi:hypothetical protein